MTASDHKPSFTPGPWKVSYRALDVGVDDDVHGYAKLFDIRGWGYLTGKGQALGLDCEEATKIQHANAHLICAAPDMYEALQKIEEWCAHIDAISPEDGELHDQIVGLASSVLSKARGES